MDAYLQREICARIKQARIEAGFTQQEIADLLNMSMRGYQNYESERVPWRDLDKIADLTGKTQIWFLRGDDPATPSQPHDDLYRKVEAVEAAVESLRTEIRAVLALPSERQAEG